MFIENFGSLDFTQNQYRHIFTIFQEYFRDFRKSIPLKKVEKNQEIQEWDRFVSTIFEALGCNFFFRSLLERIINSKNHK
jgi:hypothetical protein